MYRLTLAVYAQAYVAIFVPAFVSVPLYQAQIMNDFWALFLTIFVATLLCMAVIGAVTERWYRTKVTKSESRNG